MGEIRPFKGILYQKGMIPNLSLVIAPPYDVISSEDQDRLYEQSSHNIIRLIKGKGSPKDNDQDNTNTRANEVFQKWLRDGVLAEDPDEAIYACQDVYKLTDGIQKVRKGFIALFKLEAFGSGSIYPHERTLAGPKEDRFQLMKACSANFSSIFSLYSDPEGKTEEILKGIWSQPPDMEILSQERILHRLWKINDPPVCKKIQDAMAGQKVFIADGHHRYETALRYQSFRKEKGGMKDGNLPYDYCMMYFSNTEDPGLSILPYHRIVKNLPQDLLDHLEERLKTWFDIKRIYFDGIAITESAARKQLLHWMTQIGRERSTFGLYMGHQRYYTLSLKRSVNIEEIVPGEGSMVWKSLDVNILHSLIFEKMLHISSQDFEKKKTLSFVSDLNKAINLVNIRNCQAAFLVNPTSMNQVKAVAINGEKMPQKSTFFYPKLPSGLVIRRI